MINDYVFKRRDDKNKRAPVRSEPEYGEFARKVVDGAGNTLMAVHSYLEQVESRIQKVTDFVSQRAPGQLRETETFLTIPVYDEDRSQTLLGCLRADQYEAAISGSATEVIVEGAGDTRLIASETIVATVEEMIADLQAQRAYIQTCLTSANNLVADFASRLTLYGSGIAASVTAKYRDMLNYASDGMNGLRALFESTKQDEPTTQNQTIVIVDGGQYAGSPWITAWAILVTEVTSFFDGIWQGITKLGEFFKGVLNGLGQLIKWVAGKIFHNLTTVYDFHDSVPYGIMDLPLMQVTFKTSASYPTLHALLGRMQDKIQPGPYVHEFYPWNNYAVVRYEDSRGGDNTDYGRACAGFVRTLSEEVDGTYYRVICDVPMAGTDKVDFVVRWGRDATGNVTMQLYSAFNATTVAGMSDAAIMEEIYLGVKSILIQANTIHPSLPDQQDVDDPSVRWDDVADAILNPTGAANLYAAIQQFYTDTDQMASWSDFFASAVMALTGYSVFAANPAINASSSPSNLVPWRNQWLYATISRDEDPPAGGFLIICAVDDPTFTNNDVFVPYNRMNPQPVAVHYQTTREQAAEILILGVTIAAIVVIAVATVKFIKWRKNRMVKGELAQATQDAFSWDYAQNPSQANLEKYTKARTANRRIQRVNHLLGFATEATANAAAANDGLDNVFGTVFNQTKQIRDQNTAETTRINALTTDVGRLRRSIVT